VWSSRRIEIQRRHVAQDVIRIGDIVKATRQTDLIITPNLNKWLVIHGDDPLPDWVAKLIYKQLTTKPRDRSASFSASSAGSCYRAQELQFLGIPQVGVIDARLSNIFKDGHWRHLRWQAMGLMSGFLDRMEAPLTWRNMLSRGTMDGVGTVPDDHPRTAWRGMEYGFELKGVNSWGYRAAVKKDKATKIAHKRQVARYFLMSGLDMFVTVYENKDTQEWFEWVEVPNKKYMDEQAAELDELVEAVKTKQLHDMLPQCKIRRGEFEDCPWGTSHGPCIRAGNWPGLQQKKKKKKRLKQ
jgi:hypothetical protein